MNIRQTYEFLLRIRLIEPRIQHAIIRYESLKSLLLPSGIRYDLDRIQTSPTDRMSAVEAEIIDTERELLEMQNHRERIAVEITGAIRKLSDTDEQAVLMAYYIGRKRMEEIAEELPCSIRTAYYLKRKGVSHLSNILK